MLYIIFENPKNQIGPFCTSAMMHGFLNMWLLFGIKIKDSACFLEITFQEVWSGFQVATCDSKDVSEATCDTEIAPVDGYDMYTEEIDQ